MTGRELWKRTWPLLLVLVATVVTWRWLANIAMNARLAGTGGVRVPIIADYDKAKDWATELLGLAGTLAGFLGIAGAAQRVGLSAGERTQSALGGMIGVLAGATLLGVGGWPVPVALAVMATGVATDRVARTLRGHDG
jgi:hypothetical protein